MRGADPIEMERLLGQALMFHRQGKFSQAQAQYALALSQQPNNSDVLHLLGTLALQTQDPRRALDLIDQALAVNPVSAAAHSDRGIALEGLNQAQAALNSYDKAIALKPEFVEAYYNRGNALLKLERHRSAADSYAKAIALKPGYAQARSGRGSALRNLGIHQLAVASAEQAIALDPAQAEAYNCRGAALQDLRRHRDAVESYGRALRLRPDFAEASYNRGNALQGIKAHQAAIANYEKAILLKPDFNDAYFTRGNSLLELQRHHAAVESYERCLQLDPDYAFLTGSLLHTKMHLCEWDHLARESARLEVLVRAGMRVSTPFSLLAITDDPALQRMAAETYAKESGPPELETCMLKQQSRNGKVHIGYFSADFHAHATSYLMAELFERHDKTKFELTAFSFGPDTKDELRKRLGRAFDRFIDVSAIADRDVARMARDIGIDIAVDLKGYTTDSRPGIFASRAAPVQVNYLGYPGTMGTTDIDYLIADRVLVPEGSEAFYTEKIIYLPDTYQVNDRRRRISRRIFRREDCGLPQEGTVFCCFNNNYKIHPSNFDLWMRILRRVDRSVLWLLQDNAPAADNLRREAGKRGVNPERLIFAERIAHAEHLARHRVADLFLDTLPYNAHTTASDALWAGLPVLTCMGKSFAGRVAASLLQAIRLPELVAATPAEYEAKAVELAAHPRDLAGLKNRLAERHLTAPLFDSRLFARHIEAAYTAIHERYRAGLKPEHVCVEGVGEGTNNERISCRGNDMGIQHEDALSQLLQPRRLTEVVDIGANPIDGEPPYARMLKAGLCRVTGFEPQEQALDELRKRSGENETYLPYALADGGSHTLNICRASGMTSLLVPDPVNLDLFDVLKPLGEVTGRIALDTRRLDDIAEIQHLDFLKIDIQGGELAVFAGGMTKLSQAVAVQTEISFVTLYQDQPPLGEIDLELRRQGFVPHCFVEIKRWPISPCVVNNDPRQPLNQLLEADLVYVRDIARPAAMSDEQLKHLALIAHHCYKSFDLALRCLMLLEQRGVLEAGARQQYIERCLSLGGRAGIAARGDRGSLSVQVGKRQPRRCEASPPVG